MYPIYPDLREKLGDPLWIDQHGVPRYAPFTPELASEVYCTWVLRLSVKCQACGKIFDCARSIAWHKIAAEHHKKGQPVPDKSIETAMKWLSGWGDAPWHNWDGSQSSIGNQCPGTTMTTDYIAVELYEKINFQWVKLKIPKQYTKWEDEVEG
jgi:hypothetical protein